MKGIALRQIEAAEALGDLNDAAEQRLFRGAFMLGACSVALMIREGLLEVGSEATAETMLLSVVAVVQDVLSEQPDPRSKPSVTFQTNFKPSRTARKKAEHKTKLDRKTHERVEMAKARKRDTVCRFPLCGCRKLKLQTEVCHVVHRGNGGNPAGDRTQTPILVLLCNHRHRFGSIALDKGTLRGIPLTDDGYDGPVAWEVYDDLGGWWEVARESKPGVVEPLTPQQALYLNGLAEMDQ